MAISDTVEFEYAGEWAKQAEESQSQYWPEKYQLGILADYLRRNNFEFVTEGRIYNYPIDILGMRENVSIAIEMKAKNFGRGIEQAQRNNDFVDFSFLAVWEKSVSDDLVSRFEGEPIGLFSVSDDITTVSNPIMSGKPLYTNEYVSDIVFEDVRNDTEV